MINQWNGLNKIEEVVQVIHNQEVLGKRFEVYGTFEQPLFLAKDVAEWIEHSNPRMMLNMVDEDEKIVNNAYTLGGNQEQWFLTEDGLYEVLMQSRKPIAKIFKKQTKQILRQIRQTGGYIPVEQQDSDEEIMAKALMIMQQTLNKKDTLLSAQKRVILEQTPKVVAYDRFISSDGLYTTTNACKMLGLNRNKVFMLLRDMHLVFQKKTEPTVLGVEKGYFKMIAGKTYPRMMITPKGVEFLRMYMDVLKK